MALDRLVGIVVLAVVVAGVLLVAAREVGFWFVGSAVHREGVAGLDIEYQDLKYYSDPELRTSEIAEFEVRQLEEEPLDKRLFWKAFVAMSQPMVVRDGLGHWAVDWQRSFPEALSRGTPAEHQVLMAIWPHAQARLEDGIVRLPVEALLPLGEALGQIARTPCDGGVLSNRSSSGHLRANWGCVVENALLPNPKPLFSRNKPMTLASHLASLEPPYAALLRRSSVSVWASPAHHKTLLQFNTEETFLVQVAGRQSIRLYDPLQTPFLYRTARSEIQCRLATSTSTTRLITPEECPWLDAELPKGTVLFRRPTISHGAAAVPDGINEKTHHRQDGMVMVTRLPWDWVEQGTPGGVSKNRENTVAGFQFAVPADALSHADSPVSAPSSASSDYTCVDKTGHVIENISPLGDLEDGYTLHDTYAVAREAVPIETELGPGDVLYLPALWWYQLTTITTPGVESNTHIGETNVDGGRVEGNNADRETGVSVMLDYRYSAHSETMLRVAAALREQMSLD